VIRHFKTRVLYTYKHISTAQREATFPEVHNISPKTKRVIINTFQIIRTLYNDAQFINMITH